MKMKTLCRRLLLRNAILGIAGAVAAAPVKIGASAPNRAPAADSETAYGSATPGAAASTVLLVFFSRAGENYFYGDRIDLEIGNTNVLAGSISDRIGCDIYEIEAAEPYSDSYDETVARNVHEQNSDARPIIANPLASLDGYDTVLLGSPIWNVRPPMIMSTFVESFDFTGKTVLPFVTYAVSGMGNAERVYQDECQGATFDEGLAVQGEEAQEANGAVEAWLQRVNLLNP